VNSQIIIHIHQQTKKTSKIQDWVKKERRFDPLKKEESLLEVHVSKRGECYAASFHTNNI
jgi:hypothetical protein